MFACCCCNGNAVPEMSGTDALAYAGHCWLSTVDVGYGVMYESLYVYCGPSVRVSILIGIGEPLKSAIADLLLEWQTYRTWGIPFIADNASRNVATHLLRINDPR